ncbi:MAG: hypothetical protein GX090_01475 [Firmicutes bacterium]|nr:hypothetical protein [Bacillota bacterium]HOB34937.1 hypothetical protein [Bacillota bacterium]HPZ90872.1 hypothetical protein [Bacillota bacterium]HQE02100.1 hypothetical protein [Bacillota bacterium]
MNKPIALLPMLLLLAPGVVIGAGLTARNFRLYYPLFAVLMVALLINVAMMIWHRHKEQHRKK